MVRVNKSLVYADVHRTPRAVPARYAAELPKDREGWVRLLDDKEPSLPTAGHIRSSLRAGDASMQERVLRSIRSMLSNKEPLPDKFIDQVLPIGDSTRGRRVEMSPSPAFTRWITSIVTGAEPISVRRFFWRYLATANRLPEMELFNRDDAPGEAIVRFCDEHADKYESFPPSVKYADLLIRAIRQLINTDSEPSLRMGAFLLVRTNDPRAIPELVTLEKNAKPSMKQHLAAAMKEGPKYARSVKVRVPNGPDAAALEARLRDLKLLPSPAEMGIRTKSGAEEEEGAFELLMRGHRGAKFDTETDDTLNYHDELLGLLASMAQPALRGIVFEEVPPSDDAPDHSSLHAYVDGELISTRARHLGDWYDVPAVIGLLNTLSRDRHSDLRYADVTAGGQESEVVVGPEQGLLQAFKGGLLDIASSDQGMSVGKTAEDFARERRDH